MLVLPVAIVVILVVLLMNRQTRRVGIVLSALLGGLLLLSALWWRGSVREVEVPATPMGTAERVTPSTRHGRPTRRLTSPSPSAPAPGPEGGLATADAEEALPVAEAENAGRSPQGRPKWVDSSEGYVDGVYEMTVVAGPFSTCPECERDMPERLCEKLEAYAAGLYGGAGGRRADAGCRGGAQGHAAVDHSAAILGNPPNVGGANEVLLRLGEDGPEGQKLARARGAPKPRRAPRAVLGHRDGRSLGRLGPGVARAAAKAETDGRGRVRAKGDWSIFRPTRRCGGQPGVAENMDLSPSTPRVRACIGIG